MAAATLRKPSQPACDTSCAVHHIARYLVGHREGAGKVALVVIDGMAFEQWLVMKKPQQRFDYTQASCWPGHANDERERHAIKVALGLSPSIRFLKPHEFRRNRRSDAPEAGS
jgi:hypothetical protein